MAEVFFYHLDGITAEDVLPDLLRRGLQRNLKLSVELADLEQLSGLSNRLWADEDAGFLPHGFAGEPCPDHQPIWLAADTGNSNGSTFRFYAGGAMPADLQKFERTSILFDGGNEQQRDAARNLWRGAKAANVSVKYWKKDDAGRWTDMAEQRA